MSSHEPPQRQRTITLPLEPPTLLVRAPTYRGPKAPTSPRPSTPPGDTIARAQPSPTHSHTSRYSVDLPRYDDYEDIPHIPSPPRSLSPYRTTNSAHSRSASVPHHNDFLDPSFLDLAPSRRSRAHSHQRSRTELLPPFVGLTLKRALSRSPIRARIETGTFTSPSPHISPQRSPERSPVRSLRSPSPTKERSGSALGVRGGGKEDGMPLTGDNRISAAARRRAAASGASITSITSTPSVESPSASSTPGIKGLGSWISGAAAQVSASIAGSKPGSASPAPAVPAAGNGTTEERQRSASIAPSLKSLPTNLQRRDSVRSGKTTPGTPVSAPLRPAAPTSGTPSFSKFTALFTSKPAPVPVRPKTDNPADDDLCTLDLALALPLPADTTTTTATTTTEVHKSAMRLLRRYQTQYKARTAQVQALKQEADVREEELEGERVRNRSLKAQLEALSRTVIERDEEAREREGVLRDVREELEEKNRFIDDIGGLSPSGEELDMEEEAEDRRASRTTEDGESVLGSVFSGIATPVEGLFTPASNTTANTSSASSIHSATTPRPSNPSNTSHPHRKSLAASSRHSLLSSEDLDRQPTVSPTKETNKIGGATWRCENCQGKSSSYAWVALSAVRTENQALKGRCAVLEGAIGDVLGMC